MAGQSYEWAKKLMALPYDIHNTLRKGDLIYKNQCLVLKSLFYSVAQYAEQWIGPFADELLGGAAAAAGMEMLKVLQNGMEIVQICAADNPSAGQFFTIVGSFGQFREVIDDTRRYCQMINRLVSQHIPRKAKVSTLEEAKLKLKEELMDHIKHKVEYDCKALQTTLRWAWQEDKLALLKSLQSLSFNWFMAPSPFKNIISKDFVSNSLIPRMNTAVGSIDSKDLFFVCKLGSGSYGEVKKEYWYTIPVAVKEFAGEFPQEDLVNEFSEDFANEVKIFRKMMATDSSHIVQLLGHCEREESVGHDLGMRTRKKKCLVLELMATDLGVLIKKGGLKSLLNEVDIMLQISKGMRHLHGNSVIYRDMKPSNILIKQRDDDSFLVKLADFGISKSDFGTGLNTEMRGTRLYMAPEMLEGSTNYSMKVDVYSFAVVCSQILTGERLDHIRWLDEIKLKQTRDELKRKMLEKNIPDRLKHLLVACWADQDNNRPNFAYICEELWIIKEKLLVETEMKTDDNLKTNHYGELWRQILAPAGMAQKTFLGLIEGLSQQN